MRVSNQLYSKQPIMDALLKHYAAFVETQTGKPAAETIAEIMAEAQKEMAELKQKITAELLAGIDEA